MLLSNSAPRSCNLLGPGCDASLTSPDDIVPSLTTLSFADIATLLHTVAHRITGASNAANFLNGQLSADNATVIIAGGNSAYNFIRGDAADLEGTMQGRDDILAGGVHSSNILIGDALLMGGHAIGGSDILVGGAFSSNLLTGDAVAMNGYCQGGNDFVAGGDDSSNILRGDASAMADWAQGGNDRLLGGANSYNELTGDADNMSGLRQAAMTGWPAAISPPIFYAAMRNCSPATPVAGRISWGAVPVPSTALSVTPTASKAAPSLAMTN